MYLGGCWYCLEAKEGRYDDSDPIGVLDVTNTIRILFQAGRKRNVRKDGGYLIFVGISLKYHYLYTTYGLKS